MDSSAVLAEAFYLVQQDLYHHIEEVEYLAEEEWADGKYDLPRTLLTELCAVIRGVLAAHRHTEAGDCQTCERAWPCPVATIIHRSVKHPDFHFVELFESKHPEP